MIKAGGLATLLDAATTAIAQRAARNVPASSTA
jgi:hypothetical protein